MALATLALAIAGTQGASAAGTDAGTVVSNSATVNYNVGASAQAPVNSLAVTFVVDDRVDITVVELSGSYTIGAAGGTNEVLIYTVTNTGNGVHDFLLTRADNATDPFGGTDNFDATPVSIFVDSNANNVYDAGTDTATYIDELGNGQSRAVFVLSNIGGAQANGDISAVTLTAQVALGGGAGAQGAAIVTDDAANPDVAGTVQIVFADAAGDTDALHDGKHSDTDAYRVGAASLTVTKTSAVILDPVNGAVNPKAIPGATVEYTVVVANAAGASATATNVVLTDSLAAEITATRLAFGTNGYGANQGIQVTAPNINGGVATALSNAADADQGDFSANVVTVNGITLNAGESATVKFQVVIQ
jgi:uncharacterized repeat protein (TIGR01451 family)